MTAASLFAYAIALMLAVATPGPAMIALIGRSVARGSGAGLRMALGIALADVSLGSLALVGLAALLKTEAWMLDVLKYGAAAYLVWLGVRMWRSPPVATPARSQRAAAILRLD
jgi:threonine/homoserine/homoserine lactone efflux protein